jgi:hypothetical protein
MGSTSAGASLGRGELDDHGCVASRTVVSSRWLVSVVVESRLGVALGRHLEIRRFAALMLGVQVLEERDAPLAAGAGGEAL